MSKRFFHTIITLFFSLFLLSGCGTNNSEPVGANTAPEEVSESTSNIATLSIVNGSTLTVSEDGQSVAVIVQALDQYNLPVTEGSLAVQYGDKSGVDGTFTPATVTIDESGLATFLYTAPNSLQDQIDDGNAGGTFTFYDVNNTMTYTSINIVFDPTAEAVIEDAPITRLVLATTTTIAISDESQSVPITVMAYNSYGQPAQSGTVYVTSSSTANSGSFSPLEVDVNGGTANFTYTAPASLVTGWNRTWTFRVKDSTPSTTVRFEYTPEVITPDGVIPATVILNPNAVTITQNNEVVSVRVLVFDPDYAPYDGGTVKVRYDENDVTNNIDVGTMSPNIAEVVNGYADFVYTGPKDISGGGSTTFGFYHDTMESSDAQDLTISFNPAAGIAINATYDLLFTASDGNSTMNLESKKFFTLTLVDNDGVLVADSDITSMTVTSLNTVTGQFITDAADQPTLNFTKNNNQVGIQSYTTSGLLPIQVNASGRKPSCLCPYLSGRK